MSCSWTKQARLDASYNEEPLAYMAVDEGYTSTGRKKVEISGTFSVRDGIILRKFITALAFRTGESLEDLFAQAVSGAKRALEE